MPPLKVALVALAACLAAAPGAGADAGSPVVHTPLGSVRGVTEGGADVFMGIRFGGVPARFAPATAAGPWGSGVLDGTRFGAMCFQASNPAPYMGISMSEDCLYLNVYRPSGSEVLNDDGPLPVMFWIHGGAFIEGTGPLYNATSLSVSQRVVVVTINCETRWRTAW